MRKGFLLAALLWSTAFPALAMDWTPDGMVVSYGRYLSVVNNRDAEYNNYRAGLIWDWNQDWALSDSIKLDGYFELAGSGWKSQLNASDNPSPEGKKSATVVSFSPVLRISPKAPTWGSALPFLDAGVGAAWLSEYDLEKKKNSPINMGGHFQFEVRLLAGVRFGEQQQYEISYGWFHYSNAGLHDQNEAIDFHAIRLGFRW